MQLYSKALLHIDEQNTGLPETFDSPHQRSYLQALAGAQLKAGQRVLIHAGSGGVGTVAIQLAKLWGAYVVTTCSAHKVSLVQVSHS